MVEYGTAMKTTNGSRWHPCNTRIARSTRSAVLGVLLANISIAFCQMKMWCKFCRGGNVGRQCKYIWFIGGEKWCLGVARIARPENQPAGCQRMEGDKNWGMPNMFTFTKTPGSLSIFEGWLILKCSKLFIFWVDWSESVRLRFYLNFFPRGFSHIRYSVLTSKPWGISMVIWAIYMLLKSGIKSD